MSALGTIPYTFIGCAADKKFSLNKFYWSKVVQKVQWGLATSSNNISDNPHSTMFYTKVTWQTSNSLIFTILPNIETPYTFSAFLIIYIIL